MTDAILLLLLPVGRQPGSILHTDNSITAAERATP